MGFALRIESLLKKIARYFLNDGMHEKVVNLYEEISRKRRLAFFRIKHYFDAKIIFSLS